MPSFSLASSYDRDAGCLTLYINGRKYEYQDVSPFVAARFGRLAARNRGRAIAYIRKGEKK